MANSYLFLLLAPSVSPFLLLVAGTIVIGTTFLPGAAQVAAHDYFHSLSAG